MKSDLGKKGFLSNDEGNHVEQVPDLHILGIVIHLVRKNSSLQLGAGHTQ